MALTDEEREQLRKKLRSKTNRRPGGGMSTKQMQQQLRHDPQTLMLQLGGTSDMIKNASQVVRQCERAARGAGGVASATRIAQQLATSEPAPTPPPSSRVHDGQEEELPPELAF